MRRFSPLVLATISAALLVLAGCTGARTPPESSPERTGIVDHPVHTPSVVSTMMRDREVDALQDSAIIRVARARVDEWNQGNLDAFLAMYDRAPSTWWAAGT
jgi:uncharacterized lipoprotein YajG